MKRLAIANELKVIEPMALSFAEPQPSWLPWHIARFCFLPRFADPKQNFASDLKLMAEAIAKDPHLLMFDVSDPQRFTACRGSLELSVNADNGEFSIGRSDDSWLPVATAETDPFGLPEEFFETSCQSDFGFATEFRSDGEALLALSCELWHSMRQGFRSTLRNGSAQVFGRWRSIDAGFSRVHLDQLLELEPQVYIDDENDVVKTVLKAKNGSVLVFSPFVALDRGLVRSKGNDNEQRAIEALAAEMRSNPPRPKAEVIVKYGRRFRISPTGTAERVWPEALAMAPGCGWDRPGRRARGVGKPAKNSK